MRYLLLILTGFVLSLLPADARSQTKLIFHKSHSGSGESFRLAYGNADFDLENSNLGMAPERTVRTAALDSLILISDTMAVMVTSAVCRRPRQQTESKWRAGKDTVYHHPLFSKKNSTAFIKSYLHEFYHFQNHVDSIIIINGDEEQQEYQFIPPASVNDDNNKGGLLARDEQVNVVPLSVNLHSSHIDSVNLDWRKRS